MEKNLKGLIAPINHAGYVYVATNAMMPGLVKIGCTQQSVRNRLKRLYSTGVPAPFHAEGARFFMDCYAGERTLHDTLARGGERCQNREFFLIEKNAAMTALEKLYQTQHIRVGQAAFEWNTEEEFSKFISKENFTGAQTIIDALCFLSHDRCEKLKLRLLFVAMRQRCEQVAIWLVRNRGVDPDIAIRNAYSPLGLPRYDLTAFEYSIMLGLINFETYLVKAGCNVQASSALCFVIDTLITNPRHYDFMVRLVDFAVKLIERGANIHAQLEVSLFTEAPVKYDPLAPFRFDLFPRNSNMTCYQLTCRLAADNPWFAKLYSAIKRRTCTVCDSH